MKNQFNTDLLTFLQNSPTPFHAVRNMGELLKANNFSELSETSSWTLKPGKYFVTRSQSSIIAFVLGRNAPESTGIRMVGAHTDSPCLKVKPQPEILNHGYLQLGVEVYGGVLLHPWFDRDLSIAGRITHTDKTGTICNTLVDLKDPIAIIPSLAIHLNREANNSGAINPQTDIPPILLQSDDKTSFMDLICSKNNTINRDSILSSDLSFYDTNPAKIIGANEEFLAGARLDNLLSCFTGLMSILKADEDLTSLLICSDHEEVGSTSTAGAQGTFLKDTLRRIFSDRQSGLNAIARSLLISTDNAHGVHPNFSTKHDSNHGPLLNQGPVIKYNANQRYATTSETAGYFKLLCKKTNVPVQEFVSRTDMPCGSTIGPITAKEIGIRTLDVGVPTFAMHSIREVSGTADALSLHLALNAFFQDPSLPGL